MIFHCYIYQNSQPHHSCNGFEAELLEDLLTSFVQCTYFYYACPISRSFDLQKTGCRGIEAAAKSVPPRDVPIRSPSAKRLLFLQLIRMAETV